MRNFKHKTILTLLALLATLVVGCKIQTENGGTATITAGYNVFGDNDRFKIVEDRPHYRMIGRLLSPNKWQCTASLVAADLIITSAHCLFSNGNFIPGTFKFELRLVDGKALDVSDVVAVHISKTYLKDDSGDWAILKIDKKLGLKYGHFDVRPLKTSDKLLVAGYGDINRQSYNMHEQRTECVVKEKFSNGLFYHTCDMGHGDSGGPLYTCNKSKCVIVGIVMGQYQRGIKHTVYMPEYTSYYANVGIDAKNFIYKLIELQNP